MVKVIRVGSAQVDEFTGLVAQMNRPGTFDNDPAVERAMVLNTSPLVADRQVIGLLARAGSSTIGRIGITLPPDSDEAHLGFLQAPASGLTAPALFDAAASIAAEHGRTTLIGPIDGSFWHRYRLKVRGFERRPYFTEPLNPPHHAELWHRAGFSDWIRYRSAFYQPASLSMDLPTFVARKASFVGRGFNFEHPTKQHWDAAIAEIHDLLTELYSDMPLFHAIDLATFRTHFAALRQVVDFELLWISRHQGRAEGFLIALPDYGLGLSHGSKPARLARLLLTKRRAKQYVVAYIGARRPGLGSAMMHDLFGAMADRKAQVIGSLTREGVVTEAYGKDYITGRNEYVLLKRQL